MEGKGLGLALFSKHACACAGRLHRHAVVRVATRLPRQCQPPIASVLLQGVFFDPPTLKPLTNNPAMRKAMQHYLDLWQLQVRRC